MSDNEPRPSFRRRAKGKRPIEGHAQAMQKEIAKHATEGRAPQTARKSFHDRFADYANL